MGEQGAQSDERMQEQETLVSQQGLLMQQMQAQIAGLTQQVKDLQDRLAKDSHNSSLPPSSDRFVRQPKSLRSTSEKKTGGQEGPQGTTLRFSDTPDEAIEQRAGCCSSCQHDLPQGGAPPPPPATSRHTPSPRSPP